MNRFFYLIWQGFKNIFTHGFMSFASVAVITACLTIMGALGLITWNINAMIAEMQNQNKIIAYVDENLSEDEARAIGSELDGMKNVESVEFVTREQAMENFEADYDDELFETIDSSTFRHRYVITLKDITQMKDAQTALQEIDGIADVNAHLDYAKKFVTFRNIVSVVSLILVGVMVLVSLFIMTNTIKLATFTRKDEIAIMKIVGATNRFIRFPFVIEGLILGAVGGGIAYLIVGGLYTVAKRRLMTTMIAGIFTMVPFHTVMIPMLITFLGVGILVGVIGGISAIRSYLKV